MKFLKYLTIHFINQLSDLWATLYMNILKVINSKLTLDT
jgi:hypothetical protein